MTRCRRAVVVYATAVMGVAALTGCSDQGEESPSDASPPAAVPANLCREVPADVVGRWNLEEVDHQVRVGTTNESTCRMRGRYQGAPVALSVSLTAFAGRDGTDSRTAMEQAFAQSCEELEASSVVTSGEARYRHSRAACEAEVQTGVAESRAVSTSVTRVIPLDGTVRIRMEHTGPGWQLVGPEATAISGTIASLEPVDEG